MSILNTVGTDMVTAAVGRTAPLSVHDKLELMATGEEFQFNNPDTFVIISGGN